MDLIDSSFDSTNFFVTVLGITGCSRSGKSRLSQVLKTQANIYFSETCEVRIICQDNFWFRRIEGSEEHIDCTNWDAFYEAVSSIYSELVEDSQRHFRRGYLIIEGFQAFHDYRIVALMDCMVYLELSKEECIARRSAPQSEHHCNPQSAAYCEKHVWPSHEEYVQRSVEPYSCRIIMMNAIKSVEDMAEEVAYCLRNVNAENATTLWGTIPALSSAAARCVITTSIYNQTYTSATQLGFKAGISYQAVGGGLVEIAAKINPWRELGLQAGSPSLKNRYRDLVANEPSRQLRAKYSLCYDMICKGGSADYYRSHTNGNVSFNANHIMVMAAVGHPGLIDYIRSEPRARAHLSEPEVIGGDTLLYIAARAGFYDVCNALLTEGADVNQVVERVGSTALHVASYYGHAPIVQLLIAKGMKTLICYAHMALEQIIFFFINNRGRRVLEKQI